MRFGNEMRFAPKFRPLAASLLLAAWFTCLPGWTDTQFYVSAPHSTPPCACGCESSSDGNGHSNAHSCTPACNLDRREGEGSGSSCKPGPDVFASRRPPASPPPAVFAQEQSSSPRATLEHFTI